MNEPRRLIDSGGEFEPLLLRAGRARAPSAAKERAFAAAAGVLAGAGGGAGVAGPNAPGAGGGGVAGAKGVAAANGAAGVHVAVTVKWIGLAALAIAGALAGAARARTLAPNDAPVAVVPPAVRATAEVRPVPTRVTTDVGAAQVSVQQTPWAIIAPDAPLSAMPATSKGWTPAPINPSSLPATDGEGALRGATGAGAGAGVERPTDALPMSAPAPGGAALSAELALLDHARELVAHGDAVRAREALATLRDYDARFPDGAMAPEASFLRIAALMKAGRRADAQRAADAFLAGDAHSPYAARVQSLLLAP